MCLNDNCQLQRLNYEKNRFIFFFVLNDSKVNGKCQKVLEKVKRPILSFSHGLPFLQFGKIDQVLQRRFYSICFPVQRKRLWNCSRSSANLGKKPTTLLLSVITEGTTDEFFQSSWMMINDVIIDGKKHAIVCSKTNQVLMDNIVFNLLGTFDGRGSVHDILEDELIEMNKFIEFNHFHIHFEFDIPLRFLGMCTPNVKTVAFFNKDEYNVRIANDNYDDYNIDIVLQHLPNIERIFFFDFEISKLFEKINRDFGPKLAKVSFYSSKDENLDLLAEVMRKQSSNFCFYVAFWAEQPDDYQMLDEQSDDYQMLGEQIDYQSLASNLEFNMKKLLLCFEPVAEPASNRVGLEFNYYGAQFYFVLRNFPGVCDAVLNANYFAPTIQSYAQPVPLQQLLGSEQQINRHEPAPQQFVPDQQFRQPFQPM